MPEHNVAAGFVPSGTAEIRIAYEGHKVGQTFAALSCVQFRVSNASVSQLSNLPGRPGRILLAVLAGLIYMVSVTSLAAQTTELEGAARGFPELRDAKGNKLAKGEFTQRVENDRLHVKIRYDFDHGHYAEENSVFRQRPKLVQESWSFREDRDGKLYREFQVQFASGTAEAKKLEDGKMKQWSEKLKIDPGRTFAGFGFSLAIKAFHDQLAKGETVKLQAVGFTPKPRTVSVEIYHPGVDNLRMADRVLRGDNFVIHPKLPWLAGLFMHVPDTQVWLTTPPAVFLRSEGPFAEPKDPVVRVDLLPGGESDAAKPASK